MEPIKEEDTPPDSASSTSREAPRGIPSPNPSPQHQPQPPTADKDPSPQPRAPKNTPTSAKPHLLTNAESRASGTSLQQLPANQIETSQSVMNTQSHSQSEAPVVVHSSRDRSESVDR